MAWCATVRCIRMNPGPQIVFRSSKSGWTPGIPNKKQGVTRVSATRKEDTVASFRGNVLHTRSRIRDHLLFKSLIPRGFQVSYFGGLSALHCGGPPPPRIPLEKHTQYFSPPTFVLLTTN